MDPDTVTGWRRAERERLLALRRALPAADRRRWSDQIEAGLRSAILQIHEELRSRGERRPRLPALPPPPDIDAARTELIEAAE